ncbi:M20/M25/M40 family metallo-hydrolase [Parasphingopyxis marina]|uniref:M20/M25/M40 family metallo-hydrolase n=1 Tax=Parasphingopyxis marina TaxID=2761622 RepID=A0A842HZZ7_9SPHN|nr:M20/M25/M40 family metallo-hydrolase [Parasphingopyxis marina]MBC2777971.1 M20/M25/M40 family metallo-hydrolase [Parasphingopyxis marina]
MTDHSDSQSGTTRRDVLRASMMAGAAASLWPASMALATSPHHDAIRAAALANREADIARIQDWIRLPSIAAENLNMPDGAEYMAEMIREVGFTDVEIVATDGHPGVFGLMDNGAERTLGIYFMYDVKQFDPSEWRSHPIEAHIVEVDGFGRAIMGRGAVNQKGPEATFLAALRAMRDAGVAPPVNLVFVAEGEEEIASPNFHQILARPHIRDAFARAEGVFMPSASQGANGEVTVNLGAKGAVELEIVSSGESWGRGPTHDIHSSLNPIVDSPAWRLVNALNTLTTDMGNRPAVDGWYENVRALTDRERALAVGWARRADETALMSALGVSHWVDDMDFEDAIVRLAQEPSINIQGLVGGYTGPGGKTILPHRAVAKIDLRLVPNQTREEAERKLRAHLDAAGYPDIEVNVSGGYGPTETAEDSRLIQSQLAAYSALGVETAINPRVAGSWPGVTFTAPPLSKPAGHFGMGYGTGAHAPNEYFVIEPTREGIAGITDATMSYVEMLYQLASAA